MKNEANYSSTSTIKISINIVVKNSTEYDIYEYFYMNNLIYSMHCPLEIAWQAQT